MSSDPEGLRHRWQFEDDDGTEMEWDTVKAAWVPVVSSPGKASTAADP